MTGVHRHGLDTATVEDYGEDGWGWSRPCEEAAKGHEGEDAALAVPGMPAQQVAW